MKTKAILVDITKCIGCRNCEQACKEAHGFPAESEPVLSATALTVVEPRGDKFVRRMCMHCQDPACASACPVGALKKTAAGPVVYEAGKCIGCRYCMLACPFGVPRYEWTKLAPYVKKCDMCAAQVAKGGVPACVQACPTGASQFGDREELLAEAQKRILENPAYVRHIYGSEEVGGTSVFFLSDVPFEKLGFLAAPSNRPLPTLTAGALGDVPTVVLIGSSLLGGLYWFTERRRQVALAESREKHSTSDVDEERS
ncbi:MAG TPA: 4Fe-4S dicluster domain-containing protein [Terriglobales bacterium]|nr:4Fe-4S dicluster domain-containing protein [Terriglobales bacterium]